MPAHCKRVASCCCSCGGHPLALPWAVEDHPAGDLSSLLVLPPALFLSTPFLPLCLIAKLWVSSTLSSSRASSALLARHVRRRPPAVRSPYTDKPSCSSHHVMLFLPSVSFLHLSFLFFNAFFLLFFFFCIVLLLGLSLLFFTLLLSYPSLACLSRSS